MGRQYLVLSQLGNLWTHWTHIRANTCKVQPKTILVLSNCDRTPLTADLTDF